jgi:phospholipid/cholesterol/gamma-HCH transport system substrate-binding protein
MTIPREVKVGALFLLGLAFFLVGLSYLRGSSVFSTTMVLKAAYVNVAGLGVGDKVIINGFRVGKVKEMRLDAASGNIVVYMELPNELRLPKDSHAMIYANGLLGTMAIQLLPGKSKDFAADGTTLADSLEVSMLESVKNNVQPLKENLEKLSKELVVTFASVNKVIGDPAQLQRIMSNVEISTQNLATASKSLARMDSILRHVEHLTATLDKNSGNVNRMLVNATATTDTLKAALPDLRKTVAETRASMESINKIMADMKNGQGTAGQLLVNKDLYDNLNKSLKSLEKLTTDFQQNPRRYIGQFSIFGRKVKEEKKPAPAQ